jgi:hypothetical protein
MTGRSGTSAGELVGRARGELVETAEAIRSHGFLERLRSREVADERLRALAGAQHAIVSSDRRSFAVLAARFPSGLAGKFFLGLAEGEGVALDKLRGLADWLGMTDEELHAHEPHPGAQAYPAFVAWLALNGPARTSSAPLANIAAWAGRGRVAPKRARPTGRGRRGGVCDFFAGPGGDFEARALQVLARDSRRATAPVLARRATRLLQATNCPSGMRSRRAVSVDRRKLPAAPWTDQRGQHTATRSNGIWYSTLDRQRHRVGIRQGTCCSSTTPA